MPFGPFKLESFSTKPLKPPIWGNFSAKYAAAITADVGAAWVGGVHSNVYFVTYDQTTGVRTDYSSGMLQIYVAGGTSTLRLACTKKE